ncbi:NAD(P)-binding protein [Cutaneotrichosporon oleaginosum]|uniref:NAD(P)-binding protein n=1 Tax=Cutaneotrichosporon oleaginosum TaxID=879819 RepID=A0A0J0XL54_9TREE|nr:NAD(P)-binding protein [Cutaneotrichosporon oleaginosum]KLT41873.1 NAD(P)-binding protein [Cutaneotrichosporon oleaginosum]TXT14791.1 hypothetical protein COLE_00984 [Cutaneotrichosporon oleaginosum]
MPCTANDTGGRCASPSGGKTNQTSHPRNKESHAKTKHKAELKVSEERLTPAGTRYPSGDEVRPHPKGALSRSERLAADRATLAATVMGQRHDDETAGLTGKGGRLYVPHRCYVCSHKYTVVHDLYHHLCPPCASHNIAKRAAGADMRGRVALVTGGRAKIGMYVALRLLRDGARVTITTRFPRDAARRFVALARADAERVAHAVDDPANTADWLDRLTIVGIDLRDPRQVLSLAAMFPVLDVLVNNAAQTIRRSADAYAPLVEGERLPLHGPTPEIRVLGGYIQSLLPALDAIAPPYKVEASENAAVVRADDVVKDRRLAYAVEPTLRGVSGPPRLDVLDAAGLRPDAGAANTWSNPIGSVPAAEVLEVQLCNAVAPLLLLNSLRPALVAAACAPPVSPTESTSRRYTYVVNVTAAEGQFSHFKTPGHAHTNMAKAGLNMLTRTVGAELAKRGVLVTSVDTGWVTDERPWKDKRAAAAAGFACPLDLEDGAARVYDPIVRGELGEALHSVLLKDYGVASW